MKILNEQSDTKITLSSQPNLAIQNEHQFHPNADDQNTKYTTFFGFFVNLDGVLNFIGIIHFNTNVAICCQSNRNE